LRTPWGQENKRENQIVVYNHPSVTCDTVTTGQEQTNINHCAVMIYDEDSGFG